MNYPAKRKSAKGYDLATREQLLERLAACGSLRAVCKAADMPSAATVHVWLQQDAEFAGAYARAKAIGIQLFADETLEIADEKMAPEDVPAAKMRIETRRWLAERMLPKVYGVKAGLEMSGRVDIKQMGRVEVAHRVSILHVHRHACIVVGRHGDRALAEELATSDSVLSRGANRRHRPRGGRFTATCSKRWSRPGSPYPDGLGRIRIPSPAPVDRHVGGLICILGDEIQ